MSFAKASVATLLALVAGNVLSTASSYGRFSFDYAISGDPRSKPLQVFDDGQKTYLQFRNGEPIPALVDASGERLFVPALEGPYVVLQGVPRDIVAQMGLARARITHSSVRSNAPQHAPTGRSVPARALPEGVQVASLAPVAMGSALSAVGGPPAAPNGWRDNSYATPRRGDQIEWGGGGSPRQIEEAVFFARGEARLLPEAAATIMRLARRIEPSAQVTVVGRDDNSYKEGLGEARARVLMNALVTAGVSRSQIVTKIGVEQPGSETKKGKNVFVPSQVRWTEAAPIPPRAVAPEPDGVRAWDVRHADGTVDKMLERWAADARWKLVWRDGPAIPVTGDAQVHRPNFLEAATYVIAESRRAGYRIKATAYSNKTIVVESE